MEEKMWNVFAGSATGTSHIESGLPCQDALAYQCAGSWLVAVVCDGAGSAGKSDIGAAHAAEMIVSDLVSIVEKGPESIPDHDDFWQEAVAAAIDNARAQLMEKLSVTSSDLSDYHATVVGVAAGPDYGVFFHIGDGAGFAVERDDWENAIVSKPENGQFCDQTFFYTMDNWQDHLRLTFFDASSDIMALMSDGAMSFAAAKGQEGLDPKFIAPVMNYLDQVDEPTGSAALANTLANSQTHAITTDDKTLVIAVKVR